MSFNIVLLSGGSGKRLWPLSNDIRSKQFIKIFKTEFGHESMVQRVYKQIKCSYPNTIVTIATSKSQVSAIHNQIGHDVDICIEPCRRDTFPAITLATAYLRDIKHLSDDEVVVVCPVDPYVDDKYFEMLKELSNQARLGGSNIYLMGIKPAHPSEKFGYIIPENQGTISKVKAFKEKPDILMAENYISKGGLWNGGVFVFKISYLLEKVHKIIGYCDYETLLKNYTLLPNISFDYEIVEKEESIEVIPFEGVWKDVGAWNSLTEMMDENVIGDAILDKDCENVHVINELDIPIIAMGLNNIVISSSPQGILVSDKEMSSYVKPIVDKLHQQVYFAEKSWGTFKVIDVEEESLTMKVTIKAGDYMNYHSHERRDEVWIVISGRGRTIVDGMEQPIKTGDVITMAAGCRHTVIADTELKLIEVQLGKEISVSDKNKYDLEVKNFDYI